MLPFVQAVALGPCARRGPAHNPRTAATRCLPALMPVPHMALEAEGSYARSGSQARRLGLKKVPALSYLHAL